MLRPEPVVVGDDALVPPSNLLVPPPNRFSHVLTLDEPYRFDRPRPDDEPDGVLTSGTPVLLIVDDGHRCRVADAQGLYVEVRRDSLRDRPDTP